MQAKCPYHLIAGWLFLFILSTSMVVSACQQHTVIAAQLEQSIPISQAAIESQASHSISLPPEFAAEIIIEGLMLPADMEFLPDGDILVAEKGLGVGENATSRVILVKSGVLQSNPVLELSTNVTEDSGISGMVLDPEFDVNGYFYIWYSTGIDALNWSGSSELRLSRFTFNPVTGQAFPGSEKIVFGPVPWGAIHHGGGLAFDAEGYLFIAVGDAGSYGPSQLLSTYLGKVLRIKPDDSPAGYSIPSDNPYVGLSSVLPEIYALGFRNPFRLEFRPHDGKLYVTDVGWNHWEEINLLEPASNYGWPEREGPCPIGQMQPCPPAGSQFTDPIVYYSHLSDQGAGITGIAFSDSESFPEMYRHKVFFADYNLGLIYYADVDADHHPGKANQLFDLPISTFAMHASAIVDLEFRYGSLYALDIVNGQIMRIYPTGSFNHSPVPVLNVDVTRGVPPLTVNFSAVGTYDPDDTVLYYIWDFADGTDVLTTTIPNVSHVYQSNGTYQARLVVQDERGAASLPLRVTISVYDGEFPEIKLENLTEPGRTNFYGGDLILYRPTRSSMEGLDSESPFTWYIELLHNQHAHPAVTAQEVYSDVFHVDSENHGSLNIRYRFTLVMKTDTGQEISAVQEIYPALSVLEFRTFPQDVTLVVNQVPVSSPLNVTAIVGVKQTIIAPLEILSSSGVGRFAYWEIFESWGRDTETIRRVEDPHLEFFAPVHPALYIGYYAYDRPAQKVFLPLIAR